MTTTEQKLIHRFLRDVGVILALLLLAMIAVFCVSKNTEAYGQAIEMKVAHLQEATTTPKLILVGGSGLAFGIDSSLLHQELGMTPVNLGLYAGIGIDPMLSMIEDAAKRNDIVVVIPEYQLLHSDPYGDGFMLLEMIQSLPSIVTLLPRESLRRAMLSSPNWLKTRVESTLGRTILSTWRNTDTLYHRVYRADQFNMYGDMVGHLDEPHRLTHSEAEQSKEGFIQQQLLPETRARMANFLDTMNERGVHVYFSWQALPETIAGANSVSQPLLAREVADVFGESHVLGTQEDFTFEDGAFFDTVNHLGVEARHERTLQLLKYLQPAILAQ